MKHLTSTYSLRLITATLALLTTACATPKPHTIHEPAVAITPAPTPAKPAAQTPHLPARCTGDVALDDALDLSQCTQIDGNLIVQNWPHAHLPAMPHLLQITGSLQIINSPNLTSLEGFENLTEIGTDFYLVNLPQIKSLTPLQNLQHIGGDIEFIALAIPRCEAENFVRHTRSADPDLRLVLDHLDDQTTCPGDDIPNQHLIVLHDDDHIPGGHHLQTIHPELARRGRYLYFLAREQGIEIKFISGHRNWARPPKRSRRFASWHAFGMGLDFNLAHHANMKVATKNFKKERDQWYIVGEIARGLGLVWGESFNDIFHLEWHPGYNDRIRADEFARMRKLTGSSIKNYRASWVLFDTPPENHIPTATTCRPGGCWHIPDPDLLNRITLAEQDSDI